MRHLLTLSIMLGVNFPGVYSEETGWNYKQTTLQSFYMFYNGGDITVDGEALAAEDVIGAFTADGVCVGWTYATTDNNNYITVPTVGDDGSDYSGNYLASGDIPTYRVFDASSGDDSTPSTQNGVLPLALLGEWSGGADGSFSNNAIYIYDGAASASNESGCSDGGSCTFDGSHWLSVGEFNDDTAY